MGLPDASADNSLKRYFSRMRPDDLATPGCLRHCVNAQAHSMCIFGASSLQRRLLAFAPAAPVWENWVMASAVWKTAAMNLVGAGVAWPYSLANSKTRWWFLSYVEAFTFSTASWSSHVR